MEKSLRIPCRRRVPRQRTPTNRVPSFVLSTSAAAAIYCWADRGQQTGFAGGGGFESMEFIIEANCVEILDTTFQSLAVAEGSFRGRFIDFGSSLGPDIDLTFGTICHRRFRLLCSTSPSVGRFSRRPPRPQLGLRCCPASQGPAMRAIRRRKTATSHALANADAYVAVALASPRMAGAFAPCVAGTCVPLSRVR
jgi:hypothetical protein